MRVALLCTGPSLSEVYHDDIGLDYDVIIALNTAGHHYAHDWLCAGDRHIMLPVLTHEEHVNYPRHGVITNASFGREAQKQGLKWLRLPLQNVDWVVKAFPDVVRRQHSRICAYSMPNALHVAYDMAAGHAVHIYGMDMTEERLDFSGQNGDHSRNRWIQECAWLREIWKPGQTSVFGHASKAVIDYLCSRSAFHPFINTS